MSHPFSRPRSPLPCSRSRRAVLGLTLAGAALAGAATASAQEAAGEEEAERLSLSDFPVETFEVYSEDGELTLKIKHTTVGLMDPNVPMEGLTVSPDGRHLAFMSMEGGSVVVYSDGVSSEPFEGFRPESLNYAPDGRLTYMGVRGKKSYCVVDGTEYKYGRISTAGIRFRKDGSRFGFVGKRSGSYFAIVDGEEIGPYHFISKQPIKLSQDNAHYGFIAKIKDKYHAVIDGTPGPGYEAIATIRFSPNGVHESYIAKDGENWHALGVQLGRFDEVREPRFTFAADGTRPGLIVRKGESWHVLLDGELSPPYADARNLSISQDGASTAYLARRSASEPPFLVLNGQDMQGAFSKLTFSKKGGSTAVVRSTEAGDSVIVNGIEGPVFDRILQPGAVFNADGTHHLYTATKGDETLVVVDGVAGEPVGEFSFAKPQFLGATGSHFYSIEEGEKHILVFNGRRSRAYEHFNRPTLHDSGRVACAARIATGRWVCYVDGEELGPRGVRTRDTDPCHLTVRNPVFDPKGERIAYCIWTPKKKGHIVVDGVRLRGFDDVMSGLLRFTPDGEHVVYAAGSGDQRYIVVDETQVAGYRGFIRSLAFQFDDDRTMHILCSLDTRFVLVEVEIGG